MTSVWWARCRPRWPREPTMLYDRRTLVVALVVSFLVNLFLAGVVDGHYMMRGANGPGAILVRQAARPLPDDERKHFIAVMRAQQPAVRASRARIRDLLQQVRDSIAAPHY